MATAHAAAPATPAVYPYTTTADRVRPGDHVATDLADPVVRDVSYSAGSVELTWHTSVGDPGQMPGQPRRRRFAGNAPIVVHGHTDRPTATTSPGVAGEVRFIGSPQATRELLRRARRASRRRGGGWR